MVPILDHECAQVFVVVCGGWSVDDQWTIQTVCVLKGVVGMVPSRSILRSGESVRHGLARSNWTLGDARDAIIL